ncbi:MAG: flavin reductase family protein [Chloroflexi bacterium]|nr:flavin reductase family protein [Chloroflexota bacterium]
MTLNPETLRTAMRNWASGVTVVTVAHDGVRHGMTVSSFTSLSVEPPLVSVSLYSASRTHDLVSAAGHFGVTILAAEQRELSDRFAGRIPDTDDRLAGLDVETLVSGAPFIVGGLAWLDCRVAQTIPTGTNTLFIGEVLDVRSREDGQPLLYFNRGYRYLTS